ncbi:hypothetical protein BD779DRAFT_1520210 [Infundibulicybe gibba]|nr:hypothetical protein BD779DRAFT_1520210 [Infundibulicybe gibba]
MMNTSTLLALLATCVTIVAGGGTITFCTDINLSGTCKDFAYSDNVCIDFGNALNDEVSSLDPVGSGHNCDLFEDFGCEGASIGFTQHHNDLRDDKFNDKASSFRCSS